MHFEETVSVGVLPRIYDQIYSIIKCELQVETWNDFSVLCALDQGRRFNFGPESQFLNMENVCL